MFRGLTALALVALLGIPFLGGCGGTVLDSAKTEDTLEHSLEAERGEAVASVDCPSGQAVEPKTTFQCTVELADGKTKTATLEIRNEEADISVLRLEEEGREGQ